MDDQPFFSAQRSWQRFLVGLILFGVGLVALLGLGDLAYWVYVTALCVLLVGFVIAMSGYLGLFIQRFAFLRVKPTAGAANEQDTHKAPPSR